LIHLDARFSDAVEAAVGDAEASTDAEIVVVAAARSGSYRDVALTAGAAAAGAALLIGVFSPWHVSAHWLPLDLLLVMLAVTWLTHRSPRLMRWFTSPDRRRRQVRVCAAEAFHSEAVHGTKRRTGLLIYISALEDAVEVLPDFGLQGVVPGAAWNELDWRASKLDGFLEGLAACGAVLAEHAPALEDNPNEIPDAPRVRP